MNTMKDEEYAVHTVLELATKGKPMLESAMVVDFKIHASDQSVYEPLRILQCNALPCKRFYRTFWRSAARRILALNKINKIL